MNQTSIRKHKSFDMNEFKKNRSIAVLNVESKVNKVDFKLNKSRMLEAEIDAKNFLKKSIEAHLTNLGYNVTYRDFKDDLKNDYELKETLENLSRNLANNSLELYRKNKLHKKTAFQTSQSVKGEFINPFYELSGADSLLYIVSEANEKTSAYTTKELFSSFLVNLVTLPFNFVYFNGNEIDHSIVAAYLIDGKNGKVLWSNIYASTLEPFNKNESYEIVKKLIGEGL